MKPVIKKVIKLSYFLFTFSLFAQNAQRTADLTSQKPSWQAVIGGEAVAPVAETTYGFAVISDGRLVSTCTSKGNVMWQKGVKGRPAPYFSAWGDFIYAITGTSTINFINPSGVTVWSRDAEFEIKAPPVTGWDGRIFVQGEENISCYGLKGNRKWKISIPKINNLPLRELPDGSFLVFLAQSKDGKTTGLRISPFGEILEDITFAGQILYAASCPEGVLMSFHDGSFGLCTIENNSAVSKWVQRDDRATSGIKAIIPGSTTSAFLYNNADQLKILIILNSSGQLFNYFAGGQLDLKQLRYCRSTAQGNFVCDNRRAIEFANDGTIFWEAQLPPKNRWNYITYTNNNQILLCMTDWVLNSFVMSQKVVSKNSQSGSDSPSAKQTKMYTKASTLNQKYDGVIYTTASPERIEEIKSTLSASDYGYREKQMLSELQEQSLSYIEELSGKERNNRGKELFYSTNPVYTQSVLESMAASETDIFVENIATLLQLESDPLLRNTLIKTAGATGYDKDGQILKAFEAVTVNSISKKDVSSAKLLCDSTYEIVRFMGRPALYRRGKAILSHFMYPQYDKSIRDYARNTLTKIISLEM